MHGLETSCFSLPWTSEQCALAFRRPSFAAFGLYSGEMLVAYISFYHVVDEMEILNLAVLPEERRKGHGRLLLSTALQAGRKMGIRKVWLEVREHNVPARALYASLGFTQSGRRKNYYRDPCEDAFILTASLS
ncbi:MAG: ribosomal protein S18-alanine N-acetyltransferase [Desulfovibrio sp.]|nr:ribosomal protein S18-alanine N-acetyltransferase [Desulfovibrio sp.]